MLDKFGSFIRLVSGWIEGIAALALLAMMVITVLDVIGGNLFCSPLSGSIDLVSLLQVIAIAFAASMTLIVGHHIRAEFIILLFPEKVKIIVETVITFLSLALFSIIVWQSCSFGYSLQKSGQVSASIFLPIYLFVYGITLGTFLVWLELLHQFIVLLNKVIKK